MLPKEYGGEMEMSKMIGKFNLSTQIFIVYIIFILTNLVDLWKQEMFQKRELILKNEKMRVRDDMFSEGAKQGRVSALTNNGHQHMVGSFRQLTVD